MAPQSDPVRWLDPGSDAPSELRSVLESAAGDGGGADALAALSAKLPLAAGAGSSLGAAAGAGAGATKKAILSWKLAAWIAGAAAAGGAVTNLAPLAVSPPPAVVAQAQQASSPPPAPLAPATPEERGAAPEEPESVPSAAVAALPASVSPVKPRLPDDAADSEPSPAAPEDRHPGPAASPRAASGDRSRGSVSVAAAAPRAAPAEDSLDAEAKLLLRAKEDLARNPQKALSAADDHSTAFAGGALAEEREVIRIEALVRLGKRDEAARAAAAFRVRHPQSTHLARVERLVRAGR